MSARGLVRLEIDRDDALHTALWILVYGKFDRQIPGWPDIAGIGERLLSRWKRKRRITDWGITLQIPREDAAWLAKNLSNPNAGTIVGGSRDPIERAANSTASLARAALRGRGRQRLTINQLRRQSRSDFNGIGERHDFNRQKTRWRKQLKERERLLARSLRRRLLTTLTGTILRSTIPE